MVKQRGTKAPPSKQDTPVPSGRKLLQDIYREHTSAMSREDFSPEEWAQNPARFADEGAESTGSQRYRHRPFLGDERGGWPLGQSVCGPQSGRDGGSSGETNGSGEGQSEATAARRGEDSDSDRGIHSPSERPQAGQQRQRLPPAATGGNQGQNHRTQLAKPPPRLSEIAYTVERTVVSHGSCGTSRRFHGSCGTYRRFHGSCIDILTEASRLFGYEHHAYARRSERNVRLPCGGYVAWPGREISPLSSSPIVAIRFDPDELRQWVESCKRPASGEGGRP